MFSSVKMEEYMESELSGIFQVKLVTKNIVRGSPGAQFMHMRVKEIEQKYLTRFSKYNFRQPPAFVNYNNTQYLHGGCNYGMQFYQRLKKTFQTLLFLKSRSKENFFLMTMRWIVSRSMKLTRSNSFILLLKVFGDKV